MMWIMMIVHVFFLTGLPLAFAQSLPFPFGNATNDIFAPLGVGQFGQQLALPIPMAYASTYANFIVQCTNGFIGLDDMLNSLVGLVNAYFMALNTTRGGEDQNQVSMRVGNETNDLTVARNIIAGNGTIFNPQAILVATWNKVEQNLLGGPPTNLRNTFQLAMAWSNTGETWAIYAYSRLEYFSSTLLVNYRYGPFKENDQRTILTIRNAAAMTAVLNGSNCNLTGVYAFRINAAPSAAPSSSPTMVPTATPTNSPTMVPTTAPTSLPTNTPSMSPTIAPTDAPTTPEECGLFGWSLICPGRHPVWFLLTLAGLVPTILFILVHL